MADSAAAAAAGHQPADQGAGVSASLVAASGTAAPPAINPADPDVARLGKVVLGDFLRATRAYDILPESGKVRYAAGACACAAASGGLGCTLEEAAGRFSSGKLGRGRLCPFRAMG